MYQKILIANRGEIAVRIIRACREMGILTVAVCSTADREALHAQLADECICIGPPRSKESYMNMEGIISAAISSGAQAIHPGFGFLSENAKFARMCGQCGIDFIGPSPEIIEKMGDKAEARRTVMNALVSVIPGTEDAVIEAESARRQADEIGFPVVIKASAGGGGKGMRVVFSPEDFEKLFFEAQRESVREFGNDRMYLEKYLQYARHIEFQILADKHGDVVHLGERDCSIQRRHQKMIEETPAAFMNDELRIKMGEAAVNAAKAVEYYSAGTIEFLVDERDNFYFMEMNTRIQVEHPVTEMVTGIDIIKSMIRISAGERINMKQEDISLRGCAIECRISAEDPERGFIPCAGKITNLYLPGGNGVRVDSCLYSGCEIPPFYDSMLVKLIVYGENRAEAIGRMQSALGELIIEGIATNLNFQYELVGSREFSEGNSRGINEFLEERCK